MKNDPPSWISADFIPSLQRERWMKAFRVYARLRKNFYRFRHVKRVHVLRNLLEKLTKRLRTWADLMAVIYVAARIKALGLPCLLWKVQQGDPFGTLPRGAFCYLTRGQAVSFFYPSSPLIFHLLPSFVSSFSSFTSTNPPPGFFPLLETVAGLKTQTHVFLDRATLPRVPCNLHHSPDSFQGLHAWRKSSVTLIQFLSCVFWATSWHATSHVRSNSWH